MLPDRLGKNEIEQQESTQINIYQEITIMSEVHARPVI